MPSYVIRSPCRVSVEVSTQNQWFSLHFCPVFTQCEWHIASIIAYTCQTLLTMDHPMMLWNHRSAWLTCGLLFAPAAFAHDALPPTWCLDPATDPTITAQFRFTAEQLEQYRLRHEAAGLRADSKTCGDPKSCGIVDDDWGFATRAAIDFCAGTAPRNATEAEPAMPFVDSPSIFIDEKEHHAYSFDSGLKGVCVICTKTTADPAR